MPVPAFPLLHSNRLAALPGSLEHGELKLQSHRLPLLRVPSSLTPSLTWPCLNSPPRAFLFQIPSTILPRGLLPGSNLRKQDTLCFHVSAPTDDLVHTTVCQHPWVSRLFWNVCLLNHDFSKGSILGSGGSKLVARHLSLGSSK